MGFETAGGKKEKQLKKDIMDMLKKHFRPELLNRIDEIVIFNRLTPQQIREIVEIQLRVVVDRLTRHNVKMNISNAVKDFLAKEGYDPVFGARPLNRAIQRHITNLISLGFVSGRIKQGDSVRVSMDKTGRKVVIE